MKSSRIALAVAAALLPLGLVAPAHAMDTTWCPACAHAPTHR